MPPDGVEWLPRDNFLSFEEIVRLAQVFGRLGVERVRLTGGEPTVRARVVDLVKMIAEESGIPQIAMTTNGHRFEQLASPLARAGLGSINVSIDTLDNDLFRQLTRRGDLPTVLRGIDAAADAGLTVKTNTVVFGGVNDDELPAICSYAWERGIVPRFIEYMPLSGGLMYQPRKQITAAQIRSRISEHFGKTVIDHRHSHTTRGPARYWSLGSEGVFGIISAMSEGFCDTCNRVRLTASGDLHACLGDDGSVGLRNLIRAGASDDDLVAAIRLALDHKPRGHNFSSCGAGAPRKHMIAIGG
jgi:cyclic pyranopterin phosphate synthase